MRPFDLVNLYLHASNKQEARRLSDQLFSAVACAGEDAIFIGDWNATPEEEPAVGPLRSGGFHLADDVADPFQRQQPTRTNGRHIDYALHTSNLFPRDREQVAGPADHHLVVYSFDVFEDEPVFKVAPPRKLLAKEPVQSDVREQAFPQEAFDQALHLRQVQRAWDLLSDAAESLLKPEPGRKRSVIPRPTVPPKAPVKQDALQSMLERRLRRLHRRICEFQKGNAPWSLLRNIRDDIASLQNRCPELSEFRDVNEDLERAVVTCIQKEMEAAKQGRLDCWQASMDEDDQALIRWVKGADACNEPTDDDVRVPVHPQLKAEFFAGKWKQIWCPETLPDAHGVDPFLSWIPEGGFSCPRPSLTGLGLKHFATKTLGRAAGADGWLAEQWVLLPQAFFDALASLWELVLATSVLPKQWTHVRCVLIPKDVGFRPISVASLAWRVGMGAVLQQISSWIDEWAPVELTGGLVGRCASQAHESLHASLGQNVLYGAKLDIAKCFDHVHIAQSLRIWQRLGAPASIIAVLSSFYGSQVKTMEWQGVSAKESFSCKRGLLQGCPCSGALLAGLMATWVHHMKSQGASVQLSVFADDRTMWSSALNELQIAVRESEAMDQVFGFSLNNAKCEFFCKCSRSRAAALKAWSSSSQRRWPVCRTFKLLGVWYNTTKARRTPVCPQVCAMVKARLRRLRTATKNQGRKRHLVRSLVISLFAHTGAWTTVSKQVQSKWRTAVETAIMGRLHSHRSRFLAWAAYLGPDCDPEFALDCKVMQHELWRLRRDLSVISQVSELRSLSRAPSRQRSARFTEVLNKWRWQPLSEMQYGTPCVVVDLLFDGAQTVKAAMRAGWELCLWANEPRAGQVDPAKAPVLKQHCAWLKSVGAVSRDPDGFTRHHITWHCPCVQVDSDRPALPTCKSEERLLLKCLPRAPRPPCRGDTDHDVCEQLLSLLRQARSSDARKVLVATDGSSRALSGQKRASWSCASGDRFSAFVLPGLDQHSHAAEAWAVLKVLQAAQATQTAVCVLCDCLSVVRNAVRVRRGGPLPAGSPGLWKEIALTSPASEIVWIPAHDRHPEWTPPFDGDPDECRALNRVADREAQSTAAAAVRSLKPWQAMQHAAAMWSQAALLRQRDALKWLELLVRPSSPDA